jgi:DNA mismatch endonuclease, patch repair protein
MADVHTKKVRSFNMSMIKGKDTKPEMLVRKFVFSKGLRYRLHDKKLPGRPDLVFPKYKKAVFIHGCYWHAHKRCKYFVLPKTKTEWWFDKIDGNRKRDKVNIAKLRDMNWEVIIVWECDLKPKKIDQTLHALVNKLIK